MTHFKHKSIADVSGSYISSRQTQNLPPPNNLDAGQLIVDFTRLYCLLYFIVMSQLFSELIDLPFGG